MTCKIIDTGVRSADENMSIDIDLLNGLCEENDLILHLYDWSQDCATYGHFTNPFEFLDEMGVHRQGLALAKRPTGGGIVFHIADLAFSVLVPSTHPAFSHNSLENYAFVNNQLSQVLYEFLGKTSELLPQEPTPLDKNCQHFCMAKPTKYDVMIDGKKIGGAAQRKTKLGFLHQGTISIAMLPESYLMDVLKKESLVLEAMKQNTFSLLGNSWSQQDLQETRTQLKQLLSKAFICS